MKRIVTTLIAVAVCAVAGMGTAEAKAFVPTSVVGLGDSRAAGTGLMPLAQPTPIDSLCWRAAWTATQIMADSYGVPAYNVACSGASTKDILADQTVSDLSGGFTTVPAQLDQLPAGLLTTRGTLVTMQAGANDVHWADILGNCLGGPADCGTAAEDAMVAASVAGMRGDLRAALDVITARGHKSRVLVGGVYDPFGSADAAVVSAVYAQYGMTLTVDEVAWLRAVRAQLNDAMQQVAGAYAKKNVSFVPIDLSLDQIQTLSDFAPFHPNYLGQSAISNAFMAAV